jgi:hypothetical protein
MVESFSRFIQGVVSMKNLTELRRPGSLVLHIGTDALDR